MQIIPHNFLDPSIWFERGGKVTAEQEPAWYFWILRSSARLRLCASGVSKEGHHEIQNISRERSAFGAWYSGRRSRRYANEGPAATTTAAVHLDRILRWRQRRRRL